MSVSVVKAAPTLMSGIKSALSALASVFASIVAAGAVSAAIENRRQPNPADLAVLGLQGVQFKRYY